MEYVGVDLQPISVDIKGDFLKLLDFLGEQEKARRIMLLYRGEEQRNIVRKVMADRSSSDLQEVFQKAFYFGDKARHFSVDLFDVDRNFLTGINDCSDKTFSFLFNRIVNVLNRPKAFFGSVRKAPLKFISFFLSGNNLNNFIDRINSVGTTEEKLKVRDYYMYFLHTSGSAGVRQESMFVSTSKSKQIALDFSRPGSKLASRVVFHYFIPRPFYFYAVAPWIIENHKRLVREIELPTYHDAGPFPSQREVAVKGALFPHFLLGMELSDEQRFIVNPNFSDFGNRLDFQRVSRQGFLIDQSEFDVRICDTGYIRWGETDLGGRFKSNDVKPKKS